MVMNPTGAREPSVDEFARVTEQPHPATPFARAVGAPGVLDAARGTLRMRHHDRDATARIRHRRNAERGATRIRWVCRGDSAVTVDVAERDEVAARAGLRGRSRDKLRAAFSVRDSDG